jgi:hypothetical protein
MPTPKDLPQKLRDYADLMESGNDYDPDADLVRQAADEIERLQSVLHEAKAEKRRIR